tara:strand:- start:50 stop:1138 length:1089 start_codon:yes stop_codon:yes gene_type:complete
MRKIYSGRNGTASITNPFQMTINTSNTGGFGSAADTFVIPTSASGIPAPGQLNGAFYGMQVDWGDGNTTYITRTNYTTARIHQYSVAGIYTIKIYAHMIRGFSFGLALVTLPSGQNDKLKVLSVAKWGNIEPFPRMFNGCENLTEITAPGQPNLIPDAGWNGGPMMMFRNCFNLTRINNLNNWNLKGITDSSYMFTGCSRLEWADSAGTVPLDFSSWNMNTNTDMTFMFLNFGISGSQGDFLCFKITSATTLTTSMFAGCLGFNNGPNTSGYELSTWDMQNVTDMGNMFGGGPTATTSFNRDISGWDTSSVNDMTGMFYYASVFNQDLSSWTVTPNVTSCSSFSLGASVWALPKPNFLSCTP